MRVIILAIVFASISGCYQEPHEHGLNEFECSDEQWLKVEKESTFCSENTSYFTSYCLSSAMERNCKLECKDGES